MAKSSTPGLERKIVTESRKVSSLKIDPKNPRKHPEKQIAAIMRSIEEFGPVDLQVIRPDGMLVGGEGRLIALQRLGIEDVDCRVVYGLPDSKYRKLGLLLNKLPEGSRNDDALLGELVAGLIEDGETADDLGFEDKELERLLAGDDPLEVKEIETGDVADEFWISVRGPLASQAEALKRLDVAMKGLDGVEVDLGTIAME